MGRKKIRAKNLTNQEVPAAVPRIHWLRFITGLPLALIALVMCYFIIKNHGLLVDENEVHYSVQNLVRHGLNLKASMDDPTHPYTTLPTFHLMIAALAKLTNYSTLPALRGYSFLLSLLSIVAFFLASKKIEPDSCDLRTVQYIFFPILYPYFFLLYTDVTSLLFIFLATYFYLSDRYSLTALCAIAGTLIRQNNILWLGFFFVLLYWKIYGREIKVQSVIRHLIQGWLFIAGATAFLVFVVMNKGIAIGYKESHHLSFHLGNIYFLLFTFFIVFLPLNIANFSKIKIFLLHYKTILFLAVFFLVYHFTFINDNPFNQADRIWFLRNKILVYFTSSLVLKSVFFIPIAYSVLSLCVTKLKHPSYTAIYPATFLFLIPMWLIEQRYYFIPFMLFLLFREKRSNTVEYGTIVYQFAMSAWIFYRINFTIFFL